MDSKEISDLIKKSAEGDNEAFINLYGAVYKPLYRIARFALKNDDNAITALRQTATDGFAAIGNSDISSASAFLEWIIKILCSKIKLLFKSDENISQSTDKTRLMLDTLPDIDRLVLAVSTICGCSDEKTAILCGYTAETAAVCLTNAEVMLKTDLLSQL